MDQLNAEEIYLEYRDKISHYVRSRISITQEAEDLVSEIFEKICTKLEYYDSSKAALSTWVYTIARNTLTDHFRVSRETTELPEEIPLTFDPYADIYNEETLKELGQALLSLTEPERELIILLYYDGLKLTQISEKMGLSYGQTKILHNKALKNLRSFLEHDERVNRLRKALK